MAVQRGTTRLGFWRQKDAAGLLVRPRTKLGHIPELDGVRGCAALAVFVLHLFITVRDASGQRVPPRLQPVMQIVGLGSFGVDTFFVLSGFLITSLLLLDREKPHYYRNFYWKRVLRIQPVYMLHLLAVWFLVPQSHGYVFLALVFLVNFDSLFHVVDVGPAWTLSIEEQFYLLWPQVVRRARVKNLYEVAIALVVGSFGLRLIMSLLFGHMAVRYTVYRLDGLGLGALLALQWFAKEPARDRAVRVIEILNSTGVLLLASAYMLLTALMPGQAMMAVSLLAVNVLVYRLIRRILLRPASGSMAWLRSSPMVFLGAISYSLYMFHTVVLDLYDRYFGPPTFATGPFLRRAGGIAAMTFLVCVLSRFLVEQPVLKLRRYVVR